MLGSELKGFKGINKSYSGNVFSPLFVKVKASIEGRVCISTIVKVGNMKNGPFLAATSSSRKDNVRASVRNAFSNMLNMVRVVRICQFVIGFSQMLFMVRLRTKRVQGNK